MLLEGGQRDDGIPDTLQTLIAARIDLLDADAKRTLQAAAVIGRVFWHGALEQLVGAEAEPALDVLCARELIEGEERSMLAGDRAVPVRARADPGRRVRDGDEVRARRPPPRVRRLGRGRGSDDAIAIRAYHLDRAATLLAELDARDATVDVEAAAHWRRPVSARCVRAGSRPARRLLLRAEALEPSTRRHYLAASAAVELADLGAVAARWSPVRDQARAAGDDFLAVAH